MQFEKASDFGDVHGSSKTSRMQQTTEAMEDQWKSLLQNIVNSGSLADPATGNPWMPSKSIILDPVNNVIGQMEGELNDQKDLNTGIMDTHTKGVAACIATRNTALDGRVKTAKEKMQGSRTTHASCRDSEDTKIGKMEGSCQHFEGLDKCDKEQDWFAQYSETQTGPLATIVEAAVTCKADIASTKSQAETCDGDQSTFAADYCSYGTQVREVCAAYETCYATQTSNWDAAETSIKKLEAEQKIIYRMLGRIRCFLNLLYEKVDQGEVPTQADINKCQDATVTDAPLDVTYQEKATTPHGCTDANAYPTVNDETAAFAAGYGPGDAGWYAAEFSSLVMSTHNNLNPASGAGSDQC